MKNADPITANARERHNARLPYFGGLDGLRALAVIGVLLYHAGLPVLGGFLGVETFFVLSGFLITALLLAEWRENNQVDLVAFWRRRALRLLPALFLALAVSAAYTAIVLPNEWAEFQSDMLASLGYIMNWHLVWSEQSYFDPTLRPPLLQHLWSLAVEEQFYLVWPLLFIVLIGLLQRKGLLVTVLGAAVASIVLMASLYEPGANPSRVYYGTDTRAGGLLIGAALALAWTPWKSPATHQKAAGIAWDVVGVLGLGGLLWSYLYLFESHPLLYRGGFALVAIGTGLLIAATTHPSSRLLPTVLGSSPLRWIGARSYGLYLWHWPVFMATSTLEGRTSEFVLLAIRLAIVLIIAMLSYRFVEVPVRQGALGRLWNARPSWLRPVVLNLLKTKSQRQYDNSMPVRWRVGSLLGVVMLVSTTCTSLPAPSSVVSTPILPSSTAALATTVPVATQVPATTVVPSQIPPTQPAAITETPEPSSTPEPTEIVLQDIEPALAQALQEILDTTVANGTIPGASIAVSIPGYEPWAATSGIASREAGTQIDEATRMRIASISKIFTAATVMTLVEEGQIGLDSSVSSWFPDLLPQGDAITVRNLLQHTSGLYDYLEDRNYVAKAYQDPERVFAPRELVTYAAQFPLAFTPGAKGVWDYSSTNYVLLGMIVQEVTGNSMATEVRRRIFAPLDLTQTYFAPDEAVEGVQANGYSRTVNQTNVAMSFAFATANIVSTPSDVRRFAEGLFGGKLLQPATLEQMLAFVNGKGQYNMPALEYGFGVMRNRLAVGAGPEGQPRPAEDVTVVGHIGGFGGFRSAVWHAPASGVTIALGVNQAATDPNILATKIWDAILTSQGR